ncbi:MAG: metallophosphoesterase [Victivallales bacterium]|nr:metallophosphoesterase [Victivallales bacterium]
MKTLSPIPIADPCSNSDDTFSVQHMQEALNHVSRPHLTLGEEWMYLPAVKALGTTNNSTAYWTPDHAPSTVSDLPAERWQDEYRAGVAFQLNEKSQCDLDKVAGTPLPHFSDAIVYNIFTADKDGIGTLGFDSDWWSEVYVNGVCVGTTFWRGDSSVEFTGKNHAYFVPVKAGKNLLAVHCCRGASSFMLACTANPVVSKVDIPLVEFGPWLASPGTGEMTVRFLTVGKIGAGVEYRRKNAEISRIAWDEECGIIARREWHSLRLTNLSRGIPYEYRIVLLNPTNPAKRIYPQGEQYHEFLVPDLISRKASFFFTADLQYSLEKQQRYLDALLQAADAKSCDFLVLGGDIGSNFDNITESCIANILPVLQKYDVDKHPLVYLRGNHETRGREAYLIPHFFGTWDEKTYSVFRFGDTAFLQLDCWEDKPADSPGAAYCKYCLDQTFIQRQLAFLNDALRSNEWTTATHRIVLCHGAPYSHYDSCMTMPFRLQEWTDPFFEGKEPRTPILLWIAGHTHRYGRSIPGTDVIASPVPPKPPYKDGTSYSFPVLTVGGPDKTQPLLASAFRVDVNESTTTVRAWDTEGNLLEHIVYHDNGTCEELKSFPHHRA